MIGRNYGDITNIYIVNGLTKEERSFAEQYVMLENALLDRNFCPLLQNVLLRDSNQLSMLIFAYSSRVMDVSVEASRAVQLFIVSVVEPLSWFASECMGRGIKIFAFQVMVWTLTMIDNLLESLMSSGMEFMDQGIAVAYQELRSKSKCISNQLTMALAVELVEHAISGPDKIKVLLNSLCQLFGRGDVKESILDAVKSVYKMRADSREKLPCEAQILANCGTAFISHKGSYLLGDFHVFLAQMFFREAKRLLPDQVCTKQSGHLDKNIRIAELVPHVRRVLLEIDTETQLSTEKLTYLGEVVRGIPCFQAPSAAELKDICSAIKFLLQMTVNGNDPQGLQKVVQTLNALSQLFTSLENQDLSRKCQEWAKTATYKEKVAV
jgi:hypothetical protein